MKKKDAKIFVIIEGIGPSGGSWDESENDGGKNFDGNLLQNKYYFTTHSPHPTPARRISQKSKG